jgi:hypothetical protein
MRRYEWLLWVRKQTFNHHTPDPAFTELATDIQNTIENEPGIKDRFAEMLESL